MATIEDITIIGLLCILLIFALRNHLMVNAMGQMVFGTMSEYLAFIEDIRDNLAEEQKETTNDTGKWSDWDGTN